jgi:hypothetical protein
VNIEGAGAVANLAAKACGLAQASSEQGKDDPTFHLFHVFHESSFRESQARVNCESYSYHKNVSGRCQQTVTQR